MEQKRFDNELRQMFQMTGEDIKPSKDLFNNIQREIKLKEENNMKSMFRTKQMKGFVIAAAICVVSISCYAASKVKSYQGYSYEKWDTLPTVSEVQETSGFSPKFVDQFENGFTFASAAPGETQANGENDEVIGAYKDISFFYENANMPDGVSASLTVHAKQNYTEPLTGEEVQLSGLKAYYDESNYRFYPPDVEPTEEDKKLEAQGKLYISYGSQEVESVTFQNLSWEEDGLEYLLMISNANLPKEEVLDMANEIIASNQ